MEVAYAAVSSECFYEECSFLRCSCRKKICCSAAEIHVNFILLLVTSASVPYFINTVHRMEKFPDGLRLLHCDMEDRKSPAPEKDGLTETLKDR